MQLDTPANPTPPVLASRGDLLAPRGFRYGTATLPVSGLAVRYRSLSDAGYSAFQVGGMVRGEDGNWIDDETKLATNRARLIALCLVDDSNTPLLTEADVSALSENWDASDSAFLYGVLRQHCGIDRRPNARVEEAKKN